MNFYKNKKFQSIFEQQISFKDDCFITHKTAKIIFYSNKNLWRIFRQQFFSKDRFKAHAKQKKIFIGMKNSSKFFDNNFLKK